MAPDNVAIDLSSHLSTLARRREAQGLQGGFQNSIERTPNLVDLDGGVPSASYYPFEAISAQFLKPNVFPIDPSRVPANGVLAWLSSFFGASGSAKHTQDFSIPRYANDESQFQLSTALSYSPPQGLGPLVKFVREFVEKVHRPGYSDWDIFIDLGAGDALPKALDVVAEPGDGCLVDEWAYSVSLGNMRSLGIVPVPIRMDCGGMDPVELDRVLATWNEEERGCRRPQVMLQVPTGHNPRGITLTADRRRLIYEVAVKWDIIIIEDDPYHFQQMTSYVPEVYRSQAYKAEVTDQDWINSLTPSFVHFDYQGRVIRLDTFSKVIGPGGRLGFLTASPLIKRHLMLAQAGRSTAASGMSQVLIGSLLTSWGHDGYIRWLRGIRGQYRMRRDWTIDLLHEFLYLQDETDDDGHRVLVAFPKSLTRPTSSKGKSKTSEKNASEKNDLLARELSVFSFVPSTAGMFLWFEFDATKHPSYSQRCLTTPPGKVLSELSKELWKLLLEREVLMRPGFVFQGFSDEEREKAGETTFGLRLAYSRAEYADLRRAMQVFAEGFVEQPNRFAWSIWGVNRADVPM